MLFVRQEMMRTVSVIQGLCGLDQWGCRDGLQGQSVLGRFSGSKNRVMWLISKYWMLLCLFLSLTDCATWSGWWSVLIHQTCNCCLPNSGAFLSRLHSMELMDWLCVCVCTVPWEDDCRHEDRGRHGHWVWWGCRLWCLSIGKCDQCLLTLFDSYVSVFVSNVCMCF